MPAPDFTRTFDPADSPPGGLAEPRPDARAPEAPAQDPEYVAVVAVGQGVRIASTEFPDGGTIHFMIKCKVQFFRQANGVELESAFDERTIVATLTACNRVILLATNEEWNGSTYVTNPAQPLYKAVAAAAMPLVRPFWATVNHTITPGSGSETTWHENSGSLRLDQKMVLNTAFFAFTHGEDTNPVHFRASEGPPTTVAPDGQVFRSEIRTYAYTGRAIPDYQMSGSGS